MKNEVTIRDMNDGDPGLLAGSEDPDDLALYEKYYEEQQAGKRDVILACCDGAPVGYLTIVWTSQHPPFRGAGIPDISDFGVDLEYREQGIGTALMDEAERRVSERSESVGLAVGLSPEYGAAQIMYSKRGYVPDGRGVHYGDAYAALGDRVVVDHSLVIIMTKRLRV